MRLLACSAVESKKSEIAGAQELACAVSCHPLNRGAAPLTDVLRGGEAAGRGLRKPPV